MWYSHGNTSAAMVATTALMGFIGHSINGDFNPQLAIEGGLIGSKYAIKSKPKNLKKFFAVTNLAAAIMMMADIFLN